MKGDVVDSKVKPVPGTVTHWVVLFRWLSRSGFLRRFIDTFLIFWLEWWVCRTLILCVCVESLLLVSRSLSRYQSTRLFLLYFGEVRQTGEGRRTDRTTPLLSRPLPTVFPVFSSGSPCQTEMSLVTLFQRHPVVTIVFKVRIPLFTLTIGKNLYYCYWNFRNFFWKQICLCRVFRKPYVWEDFGELTNIDLLRLCRISMEGVGLNWTESSSQIPKHYQGNLTISFHDIWSVEFVGK